MANRKREDDSLRSAAEKLIGTGKAKLAAPEATDIERILHELTVHQIELEAQNENLRQVQIQAEEARQHYSLLFHDAPVAYVVLDDRGIIKEVNRQGEKLIGLPASLLVGGPLSLYLSPDSLTTFLGHLASSLSAKEKKRCEVVLVNRSTHASANVLVETVSLASISGSNRARSALIDVTERTRMGQEIAHLASFPELNPNPVIEVDLEGKIRYLNSAARRQFNPRAPI